MKNNNIANVGGGAAGLMAAGFAARQDNKVTIFEKWNIGKKVLISGNGRCNLTNKCDVKELVRNTVTNGKFLYNAFYSFTSQQTIDFFNKLGLATKVERGNRVFPLSDNSVDVLKALKKFLAGKKIKIKYETVIGIKKEEKFKILTASHKSYEFDKVIITTGGKSFPGTGSTGDGYKFARELGHSIIEPKPALVPLKVKDKWLKELNQLKLKNVKAVILNKNKEIVYENFGELYFRDNYIDGPIIITASSVIDKIADKILSIDLKPALDEKKLDRRLIREFNCNRFYKNVLKNLIPLKMINLFIKFSHIPAQKKVNQITKAERYRIIKLLKNFRIHLQARMGFSRAIVTSGGIPVNEINPKTLESKICKGLYFAGEVIDVDALTGGFNLQIAWSTGYVAGKSAGEK